MVSKTEYRDRKYLLIGILLGASFGFLGSFTSGFYFWSRDHPEDTYMFLGYAAVFVLLGSFCYYMIRVLEKKSK